MNYEQLKLENQLCFPFYAVSRLIIRAYQEDLDVLGITYPQYLVMMVLWENNEQTVNEIAEKLILNTNTVTPLLKRMEAMQLITRTPSKTDQRKVLVALTDSGRAMREQAAEIPFKLMNRLNNDISPAQMEEAAMLKNKLYELIHLLEKAEK
ncbi:MAG: MarR family transcriptional regulator [Paludibacter sp.]|jgi:DNA-binding MarR family transcriptional regulator|nr:MarR family transcriptional regulator [Paludibacter sp.]